MRVLLLINPKARRGDAYAAEVATAFAAAGCEILREPPELGDAGIALMQRYRERVDAVVIGGGDGTLIASIPGIVATGLPLGILPLGTFNDLARTLQIPMRAQDAVDTICGGHTRTIDVGRVQGRYFVNEASIGLSTRIARRQTTEAKKRFGFLAIAASTLTALRYSRPFGVEIGYGGRTEQFRTLQLTIANSHHFGGLLTNKEAAIDDGKLDLYSLELRRWTDVLPLLGRIARHEIADSPQVRARSSTQFEIRTRRPHHIFTDGEPAGMTPATFDVLPRAIKVFVPRDDNASA